MRVLYLRAGDRVDGNQDAVRDLDEQCGVEDGGRDQHEEMPDGVLEGQPLPHMEDDADGVERAADGDKHHGGCRDRLADRPEGQDEGPAERKVERQRVALPPMRHEQLAQKAERRARPDADQQPLADRAPGDHAIGRVGSGDLDVDGRVVEPAEPVESPAARQPHRRQIVAGRECQHRDQAKAVDRHRRDQRPVAAPNRGQRDQHRHGEQRAHDADQMNSGIGHLFGTGVGAAIGQELHDHQI